jgi:hypothetical protein
MITASASNIVSVSTARAPDPSSSSSRSSKWNPGQAYQSRKAQPGTHASAAPSKRSSPSQRSPVLRRRDVPPGDSDGPLRGSNPACARIRLRLASASLTHSPCADERNTPLGGPSVPDDRHRIDPPVLFGADCHPQRQNPISYSALCV